MARKVGIRQNTIQAWIGGCRVAFDPRTTAEVCDTRDDKNYKALEQWMRKADWEDRQAEKRKQAKQAAE